MKLTKILSTFNLTKKELSIFETILMLKEVKVGRLAKECSIPRQTLYYILDKFQNLELVTETRVGRVKLYRTSIEIIEKALKLRQESIINAIEDFKIEKKKIKSKEVENINPKIAIYRGKPGISYILNEMTKTYERSKYKTFRAYTMSQFKEGFEEEFKKFIIARNKAGVESKIFVPKQTNFENIMGYNKLGREFKVLDMEDYGCALYIVGNKTYLVSYRDNEGFIIENQNLALFLKEIFEIHWKNIKN
ncbi:MAG: helix-turn-helix domain-containing protein [Patescibacteria group bacterium]